MQTDQTQTDTDRQKDALELPVPALETVDDLQGLAKESSSSQGCG